MAGEKGTGKSTLIEALAVAAGFNAEGGSRNLMFETYPTHSELSDHLILRYDRNFLAAPERMFHHLFKDEE